MSNIIVVPYTKEHLSQFKCDDKFTLMYSRMKDFLLSDVSNHRVVIGTVFYQDKTIAIIGYFEMWDGVIEVFHIPGDLNICNIRKVYRLIKVYLSNLVRQAWVHRIQATARVQDKTEKWFTKLGFTREGILRKFNPKYEDVYIWGMIKNG